MKLNNMKPSVGSTHSKKRIGRGEGSGHGGTATRGTKGAQARAGYSRKVGFEGGQMPIQRRLPKYGFNNPTRVEYIAVNLNTIQALCEKNDIDRVDIEVLRNAGLAAKTDLVKILGTGELKQKVDVTANAFSKSAIAKIEAKEGKATII